MAIQRPFNISLRSKTIDANESNEVSWSVSGDFSTAYKISILSNDDNSLVWTSDKVNSYSLKHIIPPQVLTNGNEYKIVVTIWNQANESIDSYAEIFQTSSRPTVTVDNIGTINSFNYNFTANYYQAENVNLRNYVVNVYNQTKNLINTSGIKTTKPIEYLVSNLKSDTSYYIEFVVTSSKGLTGTSGLIPFDVSYYQPKMSLNLEAKNINKAGIELSWFVRQILFKGENFSFIDNEKIDLKNTYIYADEGFETGQDFTMKIWLEDVPSKQDLIIMTGVNGKLKLQYDAVQQTFILSKKINDKIPESWISNEVNGYSYFVLIQQINKDFNISAQVIE